MLSPVEGSLSQGTDPNRSAGLRPLSEATQGQNPDGAIRGQEGKAKSGPGQPGRAGDTVNLSPEATAQVAKLKARDQEVRAHEAAHLAAGGGVTKGGATFSYQSGPDGRSYATGGEVAVDTSPVPNNPQATIAKANAIRASALAPASPSPQDQSVASAAATMAANAAAELSKAQNANPAKPAGAAPRPEAAGSPAKASGAAEPPDLAGEAIGPPEHASKAAGAPAKSGPTGVAPRTPHRVGALFDFTA